MARATRRAVEVRREEILRAAVDVVQRVGLAGTRVSDVAAALEVSPALVHYHFATKERLLAEAFAWAEERELEPVAAALATAGSATERLARLLKVYAPAGVSSPSWRLWIDGWGAAMRSADLRAVSRRLDRRWQAAFESVLGDGVASGEFACQDARGAATRIRALVDGLAVQTTVYGRSVTLRELRAWVRAAAATELGIDAAALG